MAQHEPEAHRQEDGEEPERAGEGEAGQPHRLDHREPEPEALTDDDAERGATRDAEHRGLGERVTRERLERDTGDGERASRQRRHGDPGQADREGHDALDRPGRRAPGHGADHPTGRERGTPATERRGGAGDEERGESPHHEGEPSLRAHSNASGWIARASSSRPSTTRGPDRKSTRLNSSHRTISYAVFCLKKKKKNHHIARNQIKNLTIILLKIYTFILN